MSNIASAMDFLKLFRPGGPWVLTSIVPDGNTTTDTFRPGDEAKIGKFIGDKEGVENIYFQVNGTGDQDITRKTTKRAIRSAEFLHVDIDPDPEKDIVDERDTILKKLKSYEPRPSIVIDSGGGYQAFWRLSEPRPIETEDAWLSFERFNKNIAAELGGDGCHNIDRIMRVPSTVNVPNRKKKKDGRTATRGSLIWAEDTTYPLDRFTPAPEVGAKPKPKAITAEASKFETVEDIYQMVGGKAEQYLRFQNKPDTDDTSRSGYAWSFMLSCLGQEIPPEDILGMALHPGHPLGQYYAEIGETKAREDLADAQTQVKPKETKKRRPVDHIAQDILVAKNLLRCNEAWYEWLGPRWGEIIHDKIYKVAYEATEEGGHPADPSVAGRLLKAMCGRAEILDEMGLPYGLVSCQNGILNLRTGELMPHDPTHRNVNALPYNYDPEAGDPAVWLKFLDSVWPEQQDCIDTLQLWMGYLLVPETHLQKILQLIGVPRSGKGTILRIINLLLGPENVASPSLDAMGGNFGLEDCVDKLAITISETRMTSQSNTALILNRLLQISGEDSLNVPRKFKGDWFGKLPARITMVGNAPLSFKQDGEALAARTIILPMNRNFTGQEDHKLGAKLEAEISAILKWAIEGYRKLQDGARLVQPASGVDAVEEQRRAENPIFEFRDEETEDAPGERSNKDSVYQAYRRWAIANGHRPMASNKFAGRFQETGVKQNREKLNGKLGPREWLDIITADDQRASWRQDFKWSEEDQGLYEEWWRQKRLTDEDYRTFDEVVEAEE